MSYHHEQFGRFYIGLMVGFLICAVWFAAATGRAPGMLVSTLIVAVTVAFARLTVDITARDGTSRAPELHWAMTFGWPCGVIRVADIAEARIVPVTFWMGIGIHLTLRGWVWNVGLGKGVQIRKRNGSDIVLGTDDPQGLLTAIERARADAAATSITV